MLEKIQTMMRAMRERSVRQAAIRELSALNDHQLADIGVERGALVEAVYGRSPRGRGV